MENYGYEDILIEEIYSGLMFGSSLLTVKNFSKELTVLAEHNGKLQRQGISLYLPSSLLKIEKAEATAISIELFGHSKRFKERRDILLDNVSGLSEIERYLDVIFWEKTSGYENVFPKHIFPEDVSQVTRDIWMEQLTFLIEHSVLAVNLKKFFTQLKNAGYAVMDKSREVAQAKKNFLQPISGIKYLMVAISLSGVLPSNIAKGISALTLIFDP